MEVETYLNRNPDIKIINQSSSSILEHEKPPEELEAIKNRGNFLLRNGLNCIYIEIWKDQFVMSCFLRIRTIFNVSGTILCVFGTKNAKKFAYIKKKEYFCTKF